MDSTQEHPDVRLPELARVSATIGLISFGGGVSGWIFREVVERRRWISTDDFLVGLSLARALPGTNVVNMAIWIGYKLRKGTGAFVAVASVITGPLVLIVALAILYQHWRDSVVVHQALLGMAAAGVGLSLSLGIKSFGVTATSLFNAFIILATFVAIAILRWPMLPVVGVLAPFSVLATFLLGKTNEK